MENKGKPVSPEEIANARKKNNFYDITTNSSTNTSDYVYAERKNTTDYTDSLSDKAIKEVFMPLGFISITRGINTEGKASIIVNCVDFSVLIEDFDVTAIVPITDENIIEINRRNYEMENGSHLKFDYNEFVNACDQLGLSPADGINDFIIENLLGKKRGYLAARKEFFENELNNNFSELPRIYQKILNPSVKTMMAQLDPAYKELIERYGSLDNVLVLLQKGY